MVNSSLCVCKHLHDSTVSCWKPLHTVFFRRLPSPHSQSQILPQTKWLYIKACFLDKWNVYKGFFFFPFLKWCFILHPFGKPVTLIALATHLLYRYFVSGFCRIWRRAFNGNWTSSNCYCLVWMTVVADYQWRFFRRLSYAPCPMAYYYPPPPLNMHYSL